MAPVRVLIIAGSDSGGGAGIQADLKAVTVLGGHAMFAITALTAQNTVGVQAVHPVPTEFVQAQFKSVSDDIGIDAVKTGMLHSAELVETVSGLVAGLQAPVVVDPVMAAASGGRLLADDAVRAVAELLIPKASLVTPNLLEAQALWGKPVANRREMAGAAESIMKLGADAVLLKGGHLEGEPADLLLDARGAHWFSAPRIDSRHIHGTGCTLASALATLLAQGRELIEAVERARLLVRRGIAAGLALGSGVGPVNAMADLAPALELGSCQERMQKALDRLEAVDGLAKMAPEIRAQIGFGLAGAASPADVVAVEGRITTVRGRLKAAGPPRAGASSHVAKIVLAAMAADPSKRAAMALRFDEGLVERARGLGWSVAEFSRADEPPEVKAREGSTLEWGTTRAIADAGKVPDVVFDRGESGKEPVLRIIAEGPERIAEMVLALAGRKDAA